AMTRLNSGVGPLIVATSSEVTRCFPLSIEWTFVPSTGAFATPGPSTMVHSSPRPVIDDVEFGCVPAPYVIGKFNGMGDASTALVGPCPLSASSKKYRTTRSVLTRQSDPCGAAPSQSSSTALLHISATGSTSPWQ